MKNIFIIALLMLLSAHLWGQHNYTFDVNYSKGMVLAHKSDVANLNSGINGMLLSINKRTMGEKKWHQYYNYPDWGVSFLLESHDIPQLKKTYSMNTHMNFYFLRNRSLVFRIAPGIMYTPTYYDEITNPDNRAISNQFSASLYLSLMYKKDYLIDNFGVQAGFFLSHYSNASYKQPNLGLNGGSIFVGINYSLEDKETGVAYPVKDSIRAPYKEPLKLNFEVGAGVSEYQFIKSQNPTYTFTTYVDKRISQKSGFQLGINYFISESARKYIEQISGDTTTTIKGFSKDQDYKRLGIFVGYELFVSKLSFFIQAGTYAYHQFPISRNIYDRLGFKYHFNKNFYSFILLKSHIEVAENFLLGIGFRL